MGDEADREREARYLEYLGLGTRVDPGTVEAHWLEGGAAFWYAAGTAEEGKAEAFRVDVRANRVEPYAVPPAKPENEAAKPRLVRKAFVYGDPDIYEAPSPDGSRLVSLDGHDLALRPAEGGASRRLSTDGTADFPWDLDGAAWSPDGRRFAVRKVDRRLQPRLPVVDWLGIPETIREIPFTRTGQPLARHEIYSVEADSGRVTRLRLGDETDHDLWIAGYLPDGSELLVLRMDRRYQRLDLLAASAETGAVRTLLTETSDTFLGALRFAVLWHRQVTLLDGGRRFLWISERDGFEHLYLYEIAETGAELLRQLTRGGGPVESVVAVDEQEGWVYYLGHPDSGDGTGESPQSLRESPYDVHLFRVRLDGTGTARLTEAPGFHTVEMAPDEKSFLDTHSTPARPPSTALRTAEGKLLRVLREPDRKALEEIGWRPPELFTVKAADGATDLYGVLYTPADFDPAKRYPVLDYIYNGPFAVWTPRGFFDGQGLYAQALAQLGFAVFLVDGRGTPERGKAFQDVVYRAFGDHEVPDHVAALRQLGASRPWMDLDRVGIFGGSWGAYMAVRALLTAPEVYRAGVATNPAVDLLDHDARAIEGYMGLYSDHPEDYHRASNLHLAERLEGKLLLIHSTSDTNAPISGTMKLLDAFVKAGKPYDLILLPGQPHVPQGASSLYWLNAQKSYFVEHLRP